MYKVSTTAYRVHTQAVDNKRMLLNTPTDDLDEQQNANKYSLNNAIAVLKFSPRAENPANQEMNNPLCT